MKCDPVVHCRVHKSLVTGPYHEPEESNLLPPIPFLEVLSIILPNSLLPSAFVLQLRMLFSPTYATCLTHPIALNIWRGVQITLTVFYSCLIFRLS